MLMIGNISNETERFFEAEHCQWDDHLFSLSARRNKTDTGMPKYPEQPTRGIVDADTRQPDYRKNITRGFAVIALVNPKTPANIGGVMRASGCYSAALVVLGGPRPQHLSGIATDTQKAWRHIPHVLVPDVFDAIPYNCIPVAVDLLPNARPLQKYQHPERAFYIFGAEDATLGKSITDRCRDRVFVPTAYCMNLAATVNVVLYDRLAKWLLK
jgi:tRNA(Leu) C34 or U34 (ribose-2'-O)-methylase TrmL